MARTTVVLLVLAACGDNLPPRRDPGPGPDPLDAICTRAPGGRVVLHQVAHGCPVPGSPPAPDCINDVVTLVTSPPNDRRLFAVELHGRIRIIENEKIRPQPFLDLSQDAGGPVICPAAVSEMGLLGLVFHPRYAENRFFYIYYTAQNFDSDAVQFPLIDVLVRYTASATDPYSVEPGSELTILSIKDPYGNHNGGMMEFGDDGYLYLATGDGGGAAENNNSRFSAQDPNSLLGKMLRIDVDRQDPGLPYAIPPDNPFSTGRREIYMLGLRNPWRWSFDRGTGDMWIADVGEAAYEEIDIQPAGQQAGTNFGWPFFEANECFRGSCETLGLTFPDVVHPHGDYISISGGQVYRGRCFPDMVGTYFYSDLLKGTLQTARRNSDGVLELGEIPDTLRDTPAGIHADSRGELYETTTQGEIFRVVMVDADL
ncbi:MAG TPA: PQQ-dependent sugar dehydrogenase [Kofleriaceae bacterium]